jgi:hypothetical protein
MCNEQKELGVIVVLEEGVELLDVVRDGKVRVVIYRDRREGLSHWYELEFLEPSGEWTGIFRIGDKNIQEAIDLFTKAKLVAASKPSPDDDE